jgi:hypothetical protein
VRNTISSPSWATPVFVARRSYVTGLFYNWGHVDVLPSLQWRGATYLDGRALLDDRETSR